MASDSTPTAVEAAAAERVRYIKHPAGGEASLTFKDPFPRIAVSQAMTVDGLLASAGGESPLDDLLLLFLPAGSATPVELQRQAEQWMNDPSVPIETPTIDIVLQSDRILWRPGRAAVLGSAKRWPELRAGLVSFAFYEAELRRLEHELNGDWSTAEADVVLTHTVDREALTRRTQVDAMTRHTALRRIRYTRLAPQLEKSSPALPGLARRLFSELALQAEVADRLKYADDRLEVYEDLYESANDRLSEFAYYRSEWRLEMWIIAILVLEVIVMLGEMWLSWRLDK